MEEESLQKTFEKLTKQVRRYVPPEKHISFSFEVNNYYNERTVYQYSFYNAARPSGCCFVFFPTIQALVQHINEQFPLKPTITP